MAYKEHRKFRDGSALVEVDGRFAIVSPDLSCALAAKNIPQVVIRSASDQFPHMKIWQDYDGIHVMDAYELTHVICQVAFGASPDATYACVRDAIIDVETTACTLNVQYLIDNYLKVKQWKIN